MGSTTRTPERERDREMEREMQKTWWDEDWSSPALKDLLPDLCRDEQLRFSCGEGEGEVNRQTKSKTQQQVMEEASSSFTRKENTSPLHSEEYRDASILPQAREALRHYNARHAGAEFDLVKPLMQSRAFLGNQAWFHLNFWARSRATNMIKRFFAELHYDQASLSDPAARTIFQQYAVIPVVQICTIIEEPLDQYRSSCAFCPASHDILHPTNGCEKFVCGNNQDRLEQRLTICNSGLRLGRPFGRHSDPDALRTIRQRDEETRQHRVRNL